MTLIDPNIYWPDYVESNCRQNYSYFTTSEYLRNGYHIVALITIQLSFFTFYTILRKTPAKMKNMKVPLLINHAWSTNMDLMFTVYSAPMTFFPSNSGVPLGILRFLDVPVKWQSWWGQTSITMMGVCFVMLYENRQSQITTIKWKIKKKQTRILFFAANYVLAFTCMIPFYLDDTPQTELRKYALERVPCPVIDFYHKSAYVLVKDNEVTRAISVLGSLCFIMMETFCFMFHTIYHVAVVKNASVSQATKAMQRRFLKNVSLQISIPFIAIVFPMFYTIYADQYNYYNQAYNNNAMLTMANYGALSTSCCLFIYKPYRDFIIGIATGSGLSGGRAFSSTTAEILTASRIRGT